MTTDAKCRKICCADWRGLMERESHAINRLSAPQSSHAFFMDVWISELYVDEKKIQSIHTKDREKKSVCRRQYVKMPTHLPVMTAFFLDRKFIQVIFDQSKIGQKKSLSLVDWQLDDGRQGGFKNFLFYRLFVRPDPPMLEHCASCHS